ncbi:DNA-binding transcriptional regulator, XRE-family HTH domain [Chitinophaga sp. CF118]|uniref:helix-turn-helix domain-containing protein n=1 Tax=Chitinophaga sp. CF118 TaxID=1884367 RepID=UPI0008DFC921|nr:helix-turn-helix transcriptional regulator [Chitinophaga sp. CF118]SFE98417.1 DNA-binding transcriptional regulator, XRE-family HTH domain [Chitinophaga sp. CF118]
MTFGEKVSMARKNKNWTQTELADVVGTSRDLIGRYERDDIKPSIEVAARIADALENSLDYLVRDKVPTVEIDNKYMPEQFVPLLTKLNKLSQGDVAHVLAVVDAFIAKTKLQSITE